MTTQNNSVSPTYDRIKEACAQKGISLDQVCRRANINRSVLEKWRKKEPKTLQILAALMDAIAQPFDAVISQPEEKDWV